MVFVVDLTAVLLPVVVASAEKIASVVVQPLFVAVESFVVSEGLVSSTAAAVVVASVAEDSEGEVLHSQRQQILQTFAELALEFLRC